VKPSKMTEHAFVCTQMVVEHDVFAVSRLLSVVCLSPPRCEAAAGLHWQCTSYPSLALCHVLIAVLFPPPLVVPLLSAVVWLASGLLYRTVMFLLLLQNEEAIET